MIGIAFMPLKISVMVLVPLLLLFSAVSVSAQRIEPDDDDPGTYYVAKVEPSRVKSMGSGEFEFIYDLRKFKDKKWYPSWASEKEVTNGDYIPDKEAIRDYLDSLPNEIILTLDMSPSQLAIDCRSWEETPPLAASFSQCSKGDFLPSVDQLLWRGKFSDDGLFAAFEYHDEYARKGLPRAAFYDRLSDAALKKIVAPGAMGIGARALAAKLWTARVLAGDSLPPAVMKNKDLLELIRNESELLRNNEVKWKPISFYTWTKKLGYIYTRDKILHEPFIKNGIEAMLVLLEIFNEDALLKKTYLDDAGRRAALTGAPKYDYVELIRRACGDKSVASVLADGAKLATAKEIVNALLDTSAIALVPAASSPENRFLESRGKDSHGDEDAVMDPFVKAIREGTIDLHPGPDGPWYVCQQHALEPLIAFDGQRESAKITHTEAYDNKLEKTFKSLYAAHRETHAKDLSGFGGYGGAELSYINRIVLMITPVNRLEPLPEVYRRTSLAYARLASIMKAGYNDVAFKGMRPEKADVDLDALKEVTYLGDLFYGFYLLSCEDIGMRPVKNPNVNDSARQRAEAFLSRLAKDNDLQQDIRFMAPIQSMKRDDGSVATSYWAVDGVDTSQHIEITYSVDPGIDYGALNPGLVTVMKTGLHKKIAAADFFEITLPGTKILNRDKFRKLANTAKNSPEGIRDALKKGMER
jgi:hypothetical protein